MVRRRAPSALGRSQCRHLRHLSAVRWTPAYFAMWAVAAAAAVAATHRTAAWSFAVGLLTLRTSPRSGVARRSAAAAGSLDAQLLVAVREGVAAVGGEAAWEEARLVLADVVKSSPDEVETWLAKAFGWSMWLAMNRPSYLKPELPAVGQLQSDLSWLGAGPLRLSPEEMRAAVAASPKAYLRDPEQSYKIALGVAPEEFREPAKFRDLLLRDPRVLELTYDCLGSCGAQCARCWRPSLLRITGGALGADSSFGNEVRPPAAAGAAPSWKSWR